MFHSPLNFYIFLLNVPDSGTRAEAAEESIEDVKGMLNDGCKMVFITAGMGGGTGTDRKYVYLEGCFYESYLLY